MEAKELVRKKVLSSVGNTDFDLKKLSAGIDEYIVDNGFQALDETFSEEIVQKVIENNLAERLSRPAEEIVLFFSNYRQIEKIRIINNKTLKIARERIHGNGNENEESLTDLEEQFEDCLQEVYKIDGLQQMLQVQISEIILNLDYAKKSSQALSQRVRDAEVISK